MSVDSISLMVQAAYAKITNQPTTIDNKETMRGSVNFQNMVNIEFNRFSKMSPDQILNHINDVRGSATTASVASSSGIAELLVSDVRQKLNKQEAIVKKSLINEASLLDLVTATTEAKNILQTMVATRDKVVDAWDKIINMQI